MVPVNGDFCSGSGAKVSKNEAEYSKVNCAKKKAAIHERKILTDRQLFSLKLLCLRCGQNFIIDQLIGLIKGLDHLGRFRMEIDFIQRFGFGRVPDSAFQDILVDACAVTKAGVGMAGGVGRIGGKLPGKLRFALTISS